MHGPVQRKPQKGHGPQPHPDRPEIMEPIEELDEVDRICRCCGKPLLPWENHTQDAEETDVHVESYVRRMRRRQTYRCDCGHVENALAPARVVPGGRCSDGFACGWWRKNTWTTCR